MRSKGKAMMTPDQLRGAARNLAHGLGIPVYIRDGRIHQQGRASHSYRQRAPVQRSKKFPSIKKRERTPPNESSTARRSARAGRLRNKEGYYYPIAKPRLLA